MGNIFSYNKNFSYFHSIRGSKKTIEDQKINIEFNDNGIIFKNCDFIENYKSCNIQELLVNVSFIKDSLKTTKFFSKHFFLNKFDMLDIGINELSIIFNFHYNNLDELNAITQSFFQIIISEFLMFSNSRLFKNVMIERIKINDKIYLYQELQSKKGIKNYIFFKDIKRECPNDYTHLRLLKLDYWDTYMNLTQESNSPGGKFYFRTRRILKNNISTIQKLPEKMENNFYLVPRILLSLKNSNYNNVDNLYLLFQYLTILQKTITKVIFSIVLEPKYNNHNESEIIYSSIIMDLFSKFRSIIVYVEDYDNQMKIDSYNKIFQKLKTSKNVGYFNLIMYDKYQNILYQNEKDFNKMIALIIIFQKTRISQRLKGKLKTNILKNIFRYT